MVRVVLVAEAWTRVVEVENADDVLDAEGMTWERDRTPPPAREDSGEESADVPSDLPRYVPAVGG